MEGVIPSPYGWCGGARLSATIAGRRAATVIGASSIARAPTYVGLRLPAGVGGAASGTTDRLHVGHAHYLCLDAHVECLPAETVQAWVATVEEPTDPHFALPSGLPRSP
jgi:hypothetical protein